MDQQFTASINDIPLDQIYEDPFITTQALQIKAYFTYDKVKAEKYFSIVKDLKFHELIKVWKKDDRYILIDNYEYLLSLRDFYKDSPKQSIKCLVVDNANLRFIKELSLRLQNISPSDNHIDRCLNIRLLSDVGLKQNEIRQIYGIKKAQSAEGRKFQRDYRIAKHSVLFNRVVGFDDTSENISLVARLARPRVVKATLNYKLADTIISVIGENESHLKKFDEEYEKYLEKLRTGVVHEDEQVNPIFSWKSFSRAKVEAIARRIGRDGETATFNDDYLLGDKEIDDQHWGLDYNETTKDLSIQALKINLADKKDSNLKRVVDFRYRAEKLVHSLDSYINRISPAKHGAKTRLSVINLDPIGGIDSCNTPKFEDLDYLDFVRKNKLLYYCNRELLLKSINLRPHNFGFERSKANSESTFALASKKFNLWYDENFLPRVSEFHAKNQNGRQFYTIYTSIRTQLNKMSGDEQNIYFGDFIINMFSIVFSEIDKAKKNRHERAQTIIESDQDSKTALWNQITKILQPHGISTEQLEAVAKDLLLKDQNRVLAAAQKLEQAIKKVSDDFDVTDFPFKKPNEGESA